MRVDTLPILVVAHREIIIIVQMGLEHGLGEGGRGGQTSLLMLEVVVVV